jgi:hypothetical protein
MILQGYYALSLSCTVSHSFLTFDDFQWHRMRKIVASYADHHAASVNPDSISEPSLPSNLTPTPTVLQDHSQENTVESRSPSVPSQAILLTAQDTSSKQVLCYTSSHIKEKISGRSCSSSRSDSLTSSDIASTSKTEEEELLDKLVECEGVLGLGQQDVNGMAVSRVRYSFDIARQLCKFETSLIRMVVHI